MAPWVFCLWSGLGCDLQFAFTKSLEGPSIFSLGKTSSTLGNLPRDSIHHTAFSPFPLIVPIKLNLYRLPATSSFCMVFFFNTQDKKTSFTCYFGPRWVQKKTTMAGHDYVMFGWSWTEVSVLDKS